MPSTVDFSDEELQRNKLIEIAWYVFDIVKVGEWLPSNDKQSNNLLVDVALVCNYETGDTKFAGTPISIRFNDKPKAKGFIEGFLNGLGVVVDVGRYELKAAEGQRIVAFVTHNEWEGRKRNEINHKYRRYIPKEQSTT